MAEIWRVIDMPATLEIMREEGQSMASEIGTDYLPPGRERGWQASTSGIYDPVWMDQLVRQAFADDFAGTDPAPVVAFFDSEVGKRIIRLELSARRAFLDPDTEAAARDKVTGSGTARDRADLIDRFIAVNDLVGYNLSGALNTNFAFLSGLATVEPYRMSESDILTRVYENVEETRADTEEWLRAYLTTAYAPLSDAELEAYIKFSDLPEGRRLNRALFAGFGNMYDTQYNALGRAVAQQLKSQDL